MTEQVPFISNSKNMTSSLISESEPESEYIGEVTLSPISGPRWRPDLCHEPEQDGGSVMEMQDGLTFFENTGVDGKKKKKNVQFILV